MCVLSISINNNIIYFILDFILLGNRASEKPFLKKYHGYDIFCCELYIIILLAQNTYFMFFIAWYSVSSCIFEARKLVPL